MLKGLDNFLEQQILKEDEEGPGVFIVSERKL
jgi:hypothetical protein